MHIRLWKLEKKHALYSSSSPVVVQLQGQPVNADCSCSSSLLYFYIFSCFIFTVTLFVCIITPNCYSTNITFPCTEVFFLEIVPYFWILNFQAFHVSNIKSHSKRITASDSGHSWSAYFSSLSLVSSNFLSVPRACNFSFLSIWQKMHLSFSYAGSAKRDHRLFSLR